MRPKLGQVVAFFKYRSTKMVNIVLDSPGIPFWQRNYYEHIIRNDQDHRIIREYILSNPLNWEKDDENR
ncbi:MAG: hypothetical protein A2X25_11425 [Chloroflexi bacterium GWB2_49_20]|nr:MAG: hypothetical protein A2X25_11425 [Chloroflexi bacterium GWB2_49_20]OGN77620.1 MAG: hypothetical protein A2X26_09695 [Chloroflexi bacterium GWC2_49_37]OGN86396.1 MAG: hypothetical protein A2X27_05850 [Chloroflexi bacterium GWD2_49_16]HBG74634.1 hypothetical protein [Anaerolineae bacterium]